MQFVQKQTEIKNRYVPTWYIQCYNIIWGSQLNNSFDGYNGIVSIANKTQNLRIQKALQELHKPHIIGLLSTPKEI